MQYQETTTIILKLQEQLALLQIFLQESQVKQLLKYCQILQEYNSHTNLVSKNDSQTILLEHVLDSLTLLPFLNPPSASSLVSSRCSDVPLRCRGDATHRPRARYGEACNMLCHFDLAPTDNSLLHSTVDSSVSPKLIDIGSGAGFPGLILAICCESLQVTLVESTGKKVSFLEQAINYLSLDNRVKVFCKRAEVMANQKQYREKYNFATARAVAKLSVAVELTLPFLNIGGIFLAQKSLKQLEPELMLAKNNIVKLGGQIQNTVILNSQVMKKELAILPILKISSTPKGYPRKMSELLQFK